MSAKETMELLKQLQGKTISGLCRVRFVFEGEAELDTGPLEVRTKDGSAFVFSAASDGEALSVTLGPWADPFAGELSVENQAWIARHGQWLRFDISAEPAVRPFIGALVTDISTLSAEASPQKVVGVQIRAGAQQIRAIVAFDQLAVRFGSHKPAT